MISQFYQQEAAKLRVQIGNLQNSNRYFEENLWTFPLIQDFKASSSEECCFQEHAGWVSKFFECKRSEKPREQTWERNQQD